MNRAYFRQQVSPDNMLATGKTAVQHLRTFSHSALLPSVLIYVLGAFGMVCMNSTTVYLMEQAVCRKHYFEVQPALVQPGGLVDEEICKLSDIQSQVASINGTYRMLVMMPGEFDSP
jgi:hypothetical protein